MNKIITHTINTSRLANINIFTCFTFVWHHPEIGNNDKNQPFWKPCAFEKNLCFWERVSKIEMVPQQNIHFKAGGECEKKSGEFKLRNEGTVHKSYTYSEN